MERVTICGAIGLMSRPIPARSPWGMGPAGTPHEVDALGLVRLVEAQGQALLAGAAGTADAVHMHLGVVVSSG